MSAVMGGHDISVQNISGTKEL